MLEVIVELLDFVYEPEFLLEPSTVLFTSPILQRTSGYHQTLWSSHRDKTWVS